MEIFLSLYSISRRVSSTSCFLSPQIALLANLVHILISLGFPLGLHSQGICGQIEKFRHSFCFHLVILPHRDHIHQALKHPLVEEFDEIQTR